MSLNNLTFLFVVLLLWGCGQDRSRQSNTASLSDTPATSWSPQKTKIKYAKKFNVETHQGYTVVTVLDPWQGANQDYRYVLVPLGKPVPEKESFRKNPHDIIQTVTIPLRSIVCTSTTYIPFLDLLNETETLVGFPGTDYISSPKARALINAGEVQDLGTETSLNVEKLIALAPDALMDYAMQGERDYVQLAQHGGIPVLFNADYLESTPLGRAEWIKFAGLFYNKVAVADSIFNKIAARYDALRSLAAKVEAQPTVFSGIMYGDTWFLPGGENSGAKFIKDAGGHYLWQGNPSEGSIKLSFESVYEKAHDAVYWIGVAAYPSFEALKNADARYADFEAFKERNVFSYNAKMGEKGGLTFFELGYARPDIVLADLIKILHPDLLPQYELFFYKRLDE